MTKLISDLPVIVTDTAEILVKALLLTIIGQWFIKRIIALMSNSKMTERMEPTIKSFMISFTKISLYTALIVSVVNILGVPMASIVAVLASCGVAVGMALQGALSNLAGGIMLIMFKPFRAGDYIDAAGVSGTVREVTIFYTVLISPDNRHITVPNGSLMNANVTNYSMEPTRRLEMIFTCSKNEPPEKIQNILLSCAYSDERVITGEPLKEPFARISLNHERGTDYTVRVWVKNSDFWAVNYDLTQKITEELQNNNIQMPAYRIEQR